MLFDKDNPSALYFSFWNKNTSLNIALGAIHSFTWNEFYTYDKLMLYALEFWATIAHMSLGTYNLKIENVKEKRERDNSRLCISIL